MTPTLQSWIALCGRVLLSVIFLLSGIGKIMDWSGTEAMMSAHGMPAVPLLHIGAIVVEFGIGLLFIVGWQTRWTALALFLFLIPTTLIFHHFWDLAEPERTLQMINFLKNLAIMGGLLEVCALGAGAISIDAWLARSRFSIPSVTAKTQAR